ncbi:conserved hypothetical protein [gamma proteobacterium HdN1]|nr:conserved hypothetical protein [gamma proteobacterium HdN1]
MERNHHPPLIQALLQAERHSDSIEQMELIETHISWVLLAGDFAYKIKKPLKLEFLDFSTLALRKHYCEEELRLNQRQTHGLYLGLCAITGSPLQPKLEEHNAQAQAFEYAVKMRRFKQSDLLDQRLAHGALEQDEITLISRTLHTFHQAIHAAEKNSNFGTPTCIRRYSEENIAEILPALGASSEDQTDRSELLAYQSWLDRQHKMLSPLFSSRKETGFVRECHGDLHLGNILLEGSVVQLFDCIEFNPELRWIDVISELAFLAMDLDHHQRPDLAHWLINDYLERSGDYAGAQLLPYYLAYRAMVRAKVAWLQRNQKLALSKSKIANDVHLNSLRQSASHYLHKAWQYAFTRKPCLLITHGFSGSGKTTHTHALVKRLGAIRLRSDVERKRIFADLVKENNAEKSSTEGTHTSTQLYAPSVTRATYAYLQEQAAALLNAGFPVIVDATHLQRWQRNGFREVAQALEAPFTILHFNAPTPVLESRIRERQRQGTDASDATIEVLRQQIRHYEPLQDDELSSVFEFDTEKSQPSDPHYSAVWDGLLSRLA